MFRPNRIGTPHIHTAQNNGSVAAFTPSQTPYNSSSWPCNVISSTPLLDFGVATLMWFNTGVITAKNRFALVAQVSVSKPLTGDTVGLEVAASLIASLSVNASVTPIVGKLTAQVGTLLGAGSFTAYPTTIGPALEPITTADGVARRALNFKEQVIIRQTSGDPSGIYGVGFQINDNSAANWNITDFLAQIQVRQLNDQQAIGYRDTLR